jgi:hypothetical protein
LISALPSITTASTLFNPLTTTTAVVNQPPIQTVV